MATVLSTENLRCPLTGKAAFLTREKAEEIIGRSYGRHNRPTGVDRMPKRAYLCECGWWHIAGTHLRGDAA